MPEITAADQLEQSLRAALSALTPLAAEGGRPYTPEPELDIDDLAIEFPHVSELALNVAYVAERGCPLLMADLGTGHDGLDARDPDLRSRRRLLRPRH
jgi:hypothetical protein